MQRMAKKKLPPSDGASESKKPARSPAWTVYARLDPDLEAHFQEYRELFEYPPDLARVLERALRELFSKAGIGKDAK